jgi:hypothetical protein
VPAPHHDAAPAPADAGLDAGDGGVAIPEWGVALDVPERANHGFDGDTYVVAIAWNTSVRITRVAEPAPAGASAAGKYFDALDAGDNVELLTQGQRGIVSYRAVSFEVRVGFRSGDQNIHRIERVSRVYAVVPLDAGHHLRCTGYLEYDAKDSAELDRVIDVCASLRPK